ncbi:MAG: tetratricopeptide repeat protein [Vreelandella alkaliphila]|uniref:tetratricopeptide repeat protein n=1 Tax=Vreelandella alkaliphila TaxID=272774 RepID=UPI003F984CBA
MSITKRFQVIITAVLLALAALTVYWPGLSGGYVFDDFPNLVDNDQTVLADLSPGQLWQGAMASDSGPLKRPIAMLSLSVERYFFGLDPRPMKLVNLGIHIANALLLFLLARLILQRTEQQWGRSFLLPAPMVALLVALAWALAPINLTGVLFVIQRMESLAALFMLLGLLAYWRGRARLAQGQGGLRWMWGGLIVGGGLGVLSKESAVMLPVYALLIEWLMFGFGPQQSAERAAVRRLFVVLLVIPAVLGLAWLLPRTFAHPEFGNRPFDVYERLWTEARVLWHYLLWIVAPNPAALSLYHDAFPISRGPFAPWTTLVSVLGLLLLVVGAFVARQRWRLLSFGIFWFLVMHLLVSTFLNLELVYEHRNYLGSFGILLALFAMLLDSRLVGMVFLRRFAVVALVILYGFLTFLRANEWSDPVQHAYFEATRQVDSPRAQYALGHELMQRSPSPDSQEFSLAMDTWREAASLPNTSLLPWQGLIFESARHGLPIDPAWWAGMKNYVSTRALSTQDKTALYSLINARAGGDVPIPAEPLRQLIQAARLAQPHDVLLMTLQANFLLNVAHEPAKAEPLLYQAVAARPKNPAGWRNLVTFQLASGEYDRAAASIERLAAVNRLGRDDAAIMRFRAKLEAARKAVPEKARPAEITPENITVEGLAP